MVLQNVSRNTPWRNKCLGEVWDGRNRTSWNFSRQHFAISCTRCCLQFLHYIRLYNLGGPQLFPSFCWLSWSCLVNIGEPSVILLQESRAWFLPSNKTKPRKQYPPWRDSCSIATRSAWGRAFQQAFKIRATQQGFGNWTGLPKLVCVGALLDYCCYGLLQFLVQNELMDSQWISTTKNRLKYSDKQTFVLSNWPSN